MKIIAESQKTGISKNFICELSEDEIAKLSGHGYTHIARQEGIKFEPGTVVNVDAAWNLITSLRRSKGELTSVRDTLKGIVKLLGPMPDLIYPTIEEQCDHEQ